MSAGQLTEEEQSLIAELRADVQLSFNSLGANDQFWNRSYVRAVFAYLEAHSYVIRSRVLKELEPDKNNVETLAKIVLMSEEVYQPGKTGKLEVGELRTAF